MRFFSPKVLKAVVPCTLAMLNILHWKAQIRYMVTPLLRNEQKHANRNTLADYEHSRPITYVTSLKLAVTLILLYL